ncbi:hypothetical protein HY948_03160 [Candidatus Gottesmanbacteria bacterium]|nr:hypothetical protein [Candidatus Gottesmanbacteria bacterium]
MPVFIEMQNPGHPAPLEGVIPAWKVVIIGKDGQGTTGVDEIARLSGSEATEEEEQEVLEETTIGGT